MAEPTLDPASLKTPEGVLSMIQSDWLLMHTALESGELAAAVDTSGDTLLIEAVREAVGLEVENGGGNAFNDTAVRLFHLELTLGDPKSPTFHGVGLKAEPLSQYLRDCFAGKDTAADPEFFLKMLFALSLLQHAGNITGDVEYFHTLHDKWKQELALFLILATMYKLEGMPDELVTAIVLGDDADPDVAAKMLEALQACFDEEKTEITMQAGVIGFFMLNCQAIERPALMLLGCLTDDDFRAIKESTEEAIADGVGDHPLFTTLGDPLEGGPAQLLWGQMLSSIVQQIQSQE
ncbi:hypothetical protein [Rhodospirillum sp. A1_3_36]|uniref:hypothetical protein n=1 Tax=Rhodospirillum sp. A1_3_36 TaxID=3391666 RepID=UPI0039A69CFD